VADAAGVPAAHVRGVGPLRFGLPGHAADGENLAGEVAQHWHDASEKLKLDGAGAATLDALGAVIGDAGQAPGLAAFARSGLAELARPLPAAPPREIVSYAPLPHVLPMLALAPPAVPHLLVTADRSGGEIMTVTGLDQHSAATRVEGDGWPVHKARAGGWSQARYQRSAEEAWATNEKEFAAAVTAAAERVGAELIVLAGDVRARAILLDHLGRPVRDTVVVVDKEIPPGSRRRRGQAGRRAGQGRGQERPRRVQEVSRKPATGAAASTSRRVLAGLAGSPFGGELAEDDLVGELSVDPCGLAQGALEHEPGALGRRDHRRVVGEGFELQPVQSEDHEPVAAQHAEQVGGQAAAAEGGP
jgi:hypothetical protein